MKFFVRYENGSIDWGWQLHSLLVLLGICLGCLIGSLGGRIGSVIVAGFFGAIVAFLIWWREWDQARGRLIRDNKFVSKAAITGEMNHAEWRRPAGVGIMGLVLLALVLLLR